MDQTQIELALTTFIDKVARVKRIRQDLANNKIDLATAMNLLKNV